MILSKVWFLSGFHNELHLFNTEVHFPPYWYTDRDASPTVVSGSVIVSSALYHSGAVKMLTLLWYPEWLSVPWQDLMHDPPELVEHLQALLLPHAGVVEAGQPWLEKATQGQLPVAHRSTRWPNVYPTTQQVQEHIPVWIFSNCFRVKTEKHGVVMRTVDVEAFIANFTLTSNITHSLTPGKYDLLLPFSLSKIPKDMQYAYWHIPKLQCVYKFT